MDELNWPSAILILGAMVTAAFLIVGTAATVLEVRKQKIAAAWQDDLRQLVRRYEQLAENTLDAQSRTAADVSELRTRTASIEQILRTVE